MPYPFVLPTTSAFSFSSSFTCESHPSLPLNASTHRGVVRDTLKTHKRLPPSSQPGHLSSVACSITTYLPYLLALDAGLNNKYVNGHSITLTTKLPPTIEWRPTLSDTAVPGKEPARAKIHSLAHELSFALATLANTYTLQSRLSLRPLYTVSSAPPTPEQRTTAITTATRLLLDAASIYDHLSTIATTSSASVLSPVPADISPPTLRAQRSLALAEATLLAVLKDDPYPAAAAADRNANDTEWMYKAPEIPRVRAHLFARLCLAAAEHAAQAHSLCVSQQGGKAGGGKVSGEFVGYLEDLRRTSRAKACRFFGVDAELGSRTGDAIGWLRAAMGELGVEVGRKTGGGLGRLRKGLSERWEDRKVERGGDWGADAGRAEETRVVEMLEAKWVKQNDTMFTQTIPAPGTLLAQMPSGREIHTIKPYQPPVLDSATLEAMRAPPDRSDEVGEGMSSDEETLAEVPGTFPGTHGEYRTGTPNYF
ncbi:hypothetical protein CONLIGDRAFT_5592 [Coniochaeta ligniaria NRRL 30616]|uniref:pH-response regulator protein palC n=1 Tax=Coniochaeta ligniaria NRRL 30616 TaxID=1408157 RepID=A0A1J7J3T4_9PEZI|nr:hypothetical protein CONLIGDRAFT_5592 [Coniochaeta ligniaria NRRL 30616]